MYAQIKTFLLSNHHEFITCRTVFVPPCYDTQSTILKFTKAARCHNKQREKLRLVCMSENKERELPGHSSLKHTQQIYDFEFAKALHAVTAMQSCTPTPISKRVFCDRYELKRHPLDNL
jgi:hypothetical protein